MDPDEDLDPADVDALDDRTAASASTLGSGGIVPVDLPSRGRLRLRSAVPVAKGYEGKAVSREALFENEVDEGDDERYQLLGEQLDPLDDVMGSGLSISGDMEEEYNKLMRETKQELSVMRQPSAEDVAQKQADAQHLKRQIESWAALVETRIHLEASLSIGHRLPSGLVAGLFREDAQVAEQTNVAAKEVEKVLANLMSLQEHLAKGNCHLPSEEPANKVVTEQQTWKTLDGRLQTVLDWALGIADSWKERTRLDARRSFKVLDQPLRLQMQALSESEPEKLRKRCTPPADKHQIFGTSRQDPEKNKIHDPEDAVRDIFDDRDFYVQLLKEVLSGGAGVLSQQDEEKQLLAEIQGRRASKRKAKEEVERRASKGRKIRFRPIEKLQNFMAGRPKIFLEGEEDLSESACNAMLSSLFAPARAVP